VPVKAACQLAGENTCGSDRGIIVIHRCKTLALH